MREIDWNLGSLQADVRRTDGAPFAPVLPLLRRDQKRRHQHGAVAIVLALMLSVLLGFIGLGLDLAMLYNRKAELQGVADSAALAAARELIGTPAGVTNALSQAAATANRFKFQYYNNAVVWSDSALQFSASGKAGSWVDASTAVAAPNGLMFTKVDTSALAPELNTVNTMLMGLVSSGLSTASTAGQAIAGRASVKVTPLGICALSTTPAKARNNPGPPANVELEQYGFRRGVGYNLMNLNPDSTPPTETFVMNPVDLIGKLGLAFNTTPFIVGPFVCAGTMPMPSVMGASISVSRPFPLAALYKQLNSRFDDYTGKLCSPNSAPPDANVKAYVSTSIPWMSKPNDPDRLQSAMMLASEGKLWTIASPPSPPAGTTAPQYGPLWSFAWAVPYSAYTAGTPEPATGYSTFGAAAWSTLYPTSTGPTPGYTGSATTIPYLSSSANYFLAPSVPNRPGLLYRRVLNVPLLSCPVATGTNVTATVLAIGRFFMTVPATATSINAEFAGVYPNDQSLGGHVNLMP